MVVEVAARVGVGGGEAAGGVPRHRVESAPAGRPTAPRMDADGAPERPCDAGEEGRPVGQPGGEERERRRARHHRREPRSEQVMDRTRQARQLGIARSHQ